MKLNKRNINYSLALCAALCLTTTMAFAEDSEHSNTYQLDPVLVTATKTPLELSKVPANATVVDGKYVEASHYKDMSQVLRDVPGVYIANYGTGVGYENSNSFYMNGTNNVLVMVDGVLMKSAGVNPPLVSLKNMNNIDRIEVVKGASSALYGSAAVGGVVNIITKKATEGVTNTISVSGGSYNQEQYSINSRGREGKWDWYALAQKDRVGDYRDAQSLKIPQHLDSKTFSFKLGYDVNGNHNIALYHDNYHADELYSDSNKKLTSIRKGNVSYHTTRAIWKGDFSDRVTNQMTLLDSKYRTNYNNYITDVRTRGLTEQLTYTGEKHTVVGGIDWRQDKVYNMKGIKLTNMSYFLQDEWKFAPQWTLTPGFRTDHHSAFGNHFSPHVALSHEFNDKTNMYVSYDEFFIAPSPSQLYGFYGNVNMKPEKGHSWEFGLRHSFSDTMMGDIHYFTRESKDKIGYNYATKKYANFDEEKARGIALNVTKLFGNHLTAKVGYAYTHVEPTPQRATNVDGYIPKHAVTIGLDYVNNKFDAQLSVRGNIDRPGPQTKDALPNFFPKTTYWITDLSANYQVTEDFKIFGRVNNLFDVFYAEHSNARGNWGGKQDEWWTAPGRNFQIGMEVKF